MGNQDLKLKNEPIKLQGEQGDINTLIANHNISSSKSQISEVNFVLESANFTKNNILSKKGSYYMSQANLAHQKVCRLLQ